MKLPYESIVWMADRLFMRSATANSLAESIHHFKIYFCYLDACGWSEQEFNAETLRRIDSNWNSPWDN
jgi:hypothetical protein